MRNNKNKKSVKFQGDMLNFCDFIQVFVFTRNHHLNKPKVYDQFVLCSVTVFGCIYLIYFQRTRLMTRGDQR